MKATYRTAFRQAAIAAIGLAVVTAAPVSAQNKEEQQDEEAQEARNQQAELVTLRARTNLAKYTKLQKRKELAAAREKTADALKQYNDINDRSNEAQADASKESQSADDKTKKQTRAKLLANTSLVAMENYNNAVAEESALEEAVKQAEEERATLKTRLAQRKRETLNQYMDRVKIEQWSQGILPQPIAPKVASAPVAPKVAPTPSAPVNPANRALPATPNPGVGDRVPRPDRAQLGGLFADPNLNRALEQLKPDQGQLLQREARAQALSRQQKAKIAQLAGARPPVQYERLDRDALKYTQLPAERGPGQ